MKRTSNANVVNRFAVIVSTKMESVMLVLTKRTNRIINPCYLRPYQLNDKQNIYRSWDSGNRNVMYVLATGGGKTVVLSSIVGDFKEHQVVLAHRQELVSQISLTLASNGIKHNLIVPDKLIKEVSTLQMESFGKSFIDPWAKTTCAGVDTLLRRLDKVEFKQWSRKIKRWTIDECHHVLKKNKWGKVSSAFGNATGLGVTATPTRTDGCGLGSHNDGVFDDMVLGPSMSELISMGNLTEYRIFCVDANNFDLSNVSIDAGGDFNKRKVSAAVEKSTITGDAVSHYKEYANGVRGLTFCTDVKAAQLTTDKFNQAGIPAMLVTAETPIGDRINASRRLKSGELLQLVNVDIFGEGYDLPVVGCVSMLRPTQSLNLFMQQFGRALRPLKGKTHAIIFDHVGNVKRHSLPNIPRVWSLEAKPKRTKSTPVDELAIPITTCKTVGCFAPYDSRLSRCPYCNSIKTVTHKTSVKQVEGDLTELHPNIISTMIGERSKIDNPPPPPTMQGDMIRLSVLKRQRIRKEKQTELRSLITQWAGNLRFSGKTDSEIYKIFYSVTGFDILKAQTLGAGDATRLMEKLR